MICTGSGCRGKIQLRRDGKEWQFASHDVTFKLDGKPWLHSRLQLERVGDRIQGYVPAIDLDQIANLSQLVSGIYPELTETLKRTRPTGKIQDLILQADAGWQGLSVSGQLSHIRVNAWHDVPGVRDLNGEFWLTPTGGSARLQLANDAIDPARHFKEPIPIDRFSARLDWWQVAQGWVLYGQDLVLDNPDLSLASRFRLDLFEHPFLALTGRIDVKNAANADRYYPLQVMDKSLVDYLSGAIKGARPRALTCSGMANSATSLPQGRGHLPGGGAAAAGLLRILPRLATAHRPADRSVVPERQPRHEQPRHPARQGQLRLGARLIPDLYPGPTSTSMPRLRVRARPSATTCRTRRSAARSVRRCGRWRSAAP